MTAPIDIEQFSRRGDGATTSPVSGKRRRPPQRTRGLFLKGPVPLEWLEAAGRLPGKALHVGVFLWFKAGVTKSMTLKPTYEELERSGVLQDAFRRAITRLEEAELVTVDKGPGRKPRVTILLPDGWS